MSYSRYRYCRWCGKQYKAKKDVNKDGFCGKVCKQALYRAYKKYVPQKDIREHLAGVMSNARKKRKKKKS